jgi:hypothetical protein
MFPGEDKGFILYERNLDWLINKRIIYRRDPIKDIPTTTYEWGWFFKEGTHECYTLFASKAKITTYRSLKWHLYVLWYLNTQLDQEEFNELVEHICEKQNGFVTFDVSERMRQSIGYEVSMSDMEIAPPNKARKVIFKEHSGLEHREKLSLVGQLIGRQSVSEADLYETMLTLNDLNIKITVAQLSRSLDCSERTIYRNMTNTLKKEKELLNKTL